MWDKTFQTIQGDGFDDARDPEANLFMWEPTLLASSPLAPLDYPFDIRISDFNTATDLSRIDFPDVIDSISIPLYPLDASQSPGLLDQPLPQPSITVACHQSEYLQNDDAHSTCHPGSSPRASPTPSCDEGITIIPYSVPQRRAKPSSTHRPQRHVNVLSKTAVSIS